MVGMADHKGSPKTIERRGRVQMARGRVVGFSVCRYERFRKRTRWMVWFWESGKRYSGVRCIPEWFNNEDEAVAAVKRKWRAVRGGFRYPLKEKK